MHFLVLDDEESIIEYFQILLKSLGNTADYFLDPRAAAEHLKESSVEYDMIFSDIIMPHVDGFEFCEMVKAIPKYKNVPLIFLSSLGSDADKIKGLNCGVDEYIEKPVSQELLALKIDQIADRVQQRKVLEANLQDNQNSILTLLQSYGDIGQVVEFYNETASADTIELLIIALFHCTDNLGLDAYLGIFTPQKTGFFATMSDVSTLEAEIIQTVRQKSRFYASKNKLFINFDDFTLFIKNMPDDSERSGAMRDTLGVLCNAFEAQLASVLLKIKLLDTKNTSVETRQMLNEVKTVQQNLESNTLSSMNTLREGMSEEFLALGLTDHQEERIMELIDACDGSIQHSIELGAQLIKKLDDASNNLDSINS